MAAQKSTPGTALAKSPTQLAAAVRAATGLDSVKTYEDAVAAARRLTIMDTVTQWSYGDLALCVDKGQYGEHKLADFADQIGVDHSTLRDYRRVAAAFPAKGGPVDRYRHPWIVYRVVLRLDDEAGRTAILKMPRLSKSRAEDEVKKRLPVPEPPAEQPPAPASGDKLALDGTGLIESSTTEQPPAASQPADEPPAGDGVDQSTDAPAVQPSPSPAEPSANGNQPAEPQDVPEPAASEPEPAPDPAALAGELAALLEARPGCSKLAGKVRAILAELENLEATPV